MKTKNSRVLSKEEQLDALCWAANEADCSYGQFSARLTRDETEDIYEKYKRLLVKKEMMQKCREETQP